MIIGTSSLLSKFSEIKIFISSKPGGVSAPPYNLNMSFSVGDDENNVRQNRQLFFDAIKINQKDIAFPKQIHSDIIKIADKPGRYNECDGLITHKSNIFLAISVADCVPIFLYDTVNHCIAAIHSGWKGSSKKILAKAIEMMAKSYNTEPGNIFAFIGYSAGACCYEIGKDVAGFFDAQFLVQKGDNKFLLDLKNFNRSLLLSSGIPEGQIEVSEFCTVCNPNFLHSYRRDGIKSGRMMGIIGLVQ